MRSEVWKNERMIDEDGKEAGSVRCYPSTFAK